MSKSLFLVLFFPLIAAAQESVSTVKDSPPVFTSSTKEKPFRARLGLLGGLAMQKSQFEVAVGWDFAKLGDRLKLVADFTLGLRPNEITLVPMVGVRLPFELKKLPKLEPYIGALVGVNVTFMRGGTAISLPLRLVAGLHYEVINNLAFGLEVGAEFGPLIAPFAAGYGAAHVGVVVAWAF